MPIFNCFIAIESSKSTNIDHTLPWHYINLIKFELHEAEVSSQKFRSYILNNLHQLHARIWRWNQGDNVFATIAIIVNNIHVRI